MNDFWWGVIVTGAVGIPLSIAANLLTPRISRYLEAFSGRLKDRNRAKAIATYERRKLLRDDSLKRDMHFVSLQNQLVVGLALAAFIFFSAAFVASLPTTKGDFLLQVMLVVALFVAVLGFFLARYTNTTISDDAAALGDFTAYEKKLVERFGPDVILEAPAVRKNK
ncbi:MAG: hypothetical protein ABIY37_14020 [Devosia sp.]